MKSSEISEKLKNEAKQNKKSASYLFYGDKRVDLLFYALEFCKIAVVHNRKLINFAAPFIRCTTESFSMYSSKKLPAIIYPPFHNTQKFLLNLEDLPPQPLPDNVMMFLSDWLLQELFYQPELPTVFLLLLFLRH